MRWLRRVASGMILVAASLAVTLREGVIYASWGVRDRPPASPLSIASGVRQGGAPVPFPGRIRPGIAWRVCGRAERSPSVWKSRGFPRWGSRRAALRWPTRWASFHRRRADPFRSQNIPLPRPCLSSRQQGRGRVSSAMRQLGRAGGRPCSNASIPSTGELGALLNEVLTEATSSLSVSVFEEGGEEREDVSEEQEPCTAPATSSPVVGLDAILHPCPGRILFTISFQMHISKPSPAQRCSMSCPAPAPTRCGAPPTTFWDFEPGHAKPV